MPELLIEYVEPNPLKLLEEHTFLFQITGLSIHPEKFVLTQSVPVQYGNKAQAAVEARRKVMLDLLLASMKVGQADLRAIHSKGDETE